MHCKTDAINQVSLQCFIKSEGWSQGKSTAFVQILQIFTVRLSSCWCSSSVSFWMWWFLGQVWGDHTEQHGSTMRAPSWHARPGWALLGTSCGVLQEQPRFAQGSCRLSPRGAGAALARSHACAAGEGFVCLPALRLTAFWLWLSTLQELFVGGF